MSRSKSAEAILATAEKWKQHCLLDGGSLFSEESLWTRENFDQLRIYFVENLDKGSGKFYEKLEQQLDPASPDAKCLWAEMTWALFLIVYHGMLKPETKRDQIRQVWEWSGSKLPDNHWALGEVLAKGVVNPGQAYNTSRWRECRFFITTMISWFSLSSEDRKALLTDPWDFAEWLDSQKYCQGRQFRHAFLYLLFPDEFEAIMSQGHKEKIVNAFSKQWNQDLLTNEKAIAGFYDVTLAQRGWRVHSQKTLHWNTGNMTDGIGTILPSMRADTVLDHTASSRRIIIDTKFTSILKPGFHRDQTLASGHIYQIYAYLRSQEGLNDPLADTASGMLLHPAVACSVDESVDIQGHKIRFATVNLDATSREIRRRLLELIDPTLE